MTSERSNPTFTVYVGPMMGGKSSALLADVERLTYQKRAVVLFKPSADGRYSRSVRDLGTERYSETEVVSHSGMKHAAVAINEAADVIKVLSDSDEPPDVVAVDEAFMVNGIADVLVWLFRTGMSVIVATIDLSATGKPFREVERMLSYATHVRKCPAVCAVCDQDAFYTYKKLGSSSDEIEVGGSELYEPRCWRHFPAFSNDV